MSKAEDWTDSECSVCIASSPQLVETARFLAQVQWLEHRLFVLLGSWAPTVPEPEVAVALAAQARHHGEHLVGYEELLPTVSELRSEVKALADAFYGPAIEALSTAQDSLECLAMLHGASRSSQPGLTSHLIALIEEAISSLSPVADAPAIRFFELALFDLEGNQRRGLSLVDVLVGDTRAEAHSDQRFPDRQRADRAQRVLAEVLPDPVAHLSAEGQ